MDTEPKLPIAISYIGSKYLIFDINAVTWLRKVHHICGVMTGTLPQSPSQNIFLGLPVHIMPEEAQLLVERGVGYIVDDARAHEETLQKGAMPIHTTYMTQIRKKGEQVSRARDEEREEARQKSMKKVKGKAKSRSPISALPDQPPPESNMADDSSAVSMPRDPEETLFDSTSTLRPSTSTVAESQPHGIVPTTSEHWLQPVSDTPPTSQSMALLPNVPPSYTLYKHLNSRSFFMTPGLRFGCQYCVYPGDPLRFHSHFLAVGKEWEEDIDLMDIVGGGRLGTGVKKGYLIGGQEPSKVGEDGTEEGRVRTFSIEWAAM